jgi:hypothetical protein
MLEFGNIDKIFKDQLLHERKAQRINAMIEDNPEITPEMIIPTEQSPGLIYEGEDHGTAVAIHERLRLSTRYNKLTPNQKQTLNAVIGFRKQKLAEAAEAQKKEQIEMMVQAEMAKAGALAKLEQMKTLGKLEIEKLRTKGDMAVEIAKRSGKESEELVKGVFGAAKTAPKAGEGKVENKET